MKSRTLKVGDKVEWKSSRGRTVGVIKRKLKSPTRIKTHKVSASKQNPEFLVQGLKSGKRAAHKPGALKKVR